MEIGICTVKDIAEFLSYIITSFSLIGLWITYALSKKQIHFSTMEKCTNDFRNIISSKDTKSEEDLSRAYIDLVNEEFFYLEKNYLPLEVCIEWVDGMIDYLPFYDKDQNLVPSANVQLMGDEQFVMYLMVNYPRIYKAIKLKNKIDFDKVRLSIISEENRKIRFKERNKLIFAIISSLKISSWKKMHLKRMIASR